MQTNEPSPISESDSTKTKKANISQTLARLLIITGVLSILAGIINFIAAVSPSLVTKTSLTDGLANAIMGILLMICSRYLKKGKVISIWLFGVTAVLDIIYIYMSGRGFNYLMATVGVFVLWQMLTLKKNKELV